MTHRKRKPNQTIAFRTYVIAILIAVAAVFGVYRLAVKGGSEGDAPTDSVAALADCLTANGTKLYGAVWCPHCQDQKAAFGEAADRIVYVECSDTSAGSGQSAACAEAKITNYPTWVFGDGTRVTGHRQFWELARYGGCEWGG